MEGKQSMISDVSESEFLLEDKSLIFLFQLPQIEEYFVISVEHQINEQISDVNNQILEYSVQNQSNLGETGRVIVRRKPKPMQPTPLYVFLFFHFHPFYNVYYFD